LSDACRLRHDTSNFCLTCNIALNTSTEYSNHIKTNSHIQALDTPQWLKCEPCDFYYHRGSREENSHENSHTHTQNIFRLPIGADPPIVEVDTPPNWTSCDACNRKFHSSGWDSHCQSSGHITRQRIFNYNNALIRSQLNQRGIEIAGQLDGIDLGIHSPNSGTENTPTTVWVKCVGEGSVSLMRARTSSSVGTRRTGGPSWYVSSC
jgi:hypothetical protein